MEWDNEFIDNGNIEAGTESLDNTQTWLRTLDRDQGQVMSSTSSVNTSRRSSMELDLSRGKSVIFVKETCGGYLNGFWYRQDI